MRRSTRGRRRTRAIATSSNSSRGALRPTTLVRTRRFASTSTGRYSPSARRRDGPGLAGGTRSGPTDASPLSANARYPPRTARPATRSSSSARLPACRPGRGTTPRRSRRRRRRLPSKDLSLVIFSRRTVLSRMRSDGRTATTTRRRRIAGRRHLAPARRRRLWRTSPLTGATMRTSSRHGRDSTIRIRAFRGTAPRGARRSRRTTRSPTSPMRTTQRFAAARY